MTSISHPVCLAACMIHQGAAFTSNNSNLYLFIVQNTLKVLSGILLFNLMKEERMAAKHGST